MEFEGGPNGGAAVEEERRVSPLRGNLSHDEIVSQTRVVKNGLSALRDDHYNVLARIREECEDKRNANDCQNSLEVLDVRRWNGLRILCHNPTADESGFLAQSKLWLRAWR